MTVPWLTLSPTLILTAVTLPAAVDGTSMVALSVSKVIKVSSTATVSPTFTATSITSTPLLSPMSGTSTFTLPPVAVAAGAAAGASAAGAAATGAAASAGAAAAAPVSTVTTTEPSDTLSPTLILTSFTTPATSAGTSMVALSVSKVIKVSSTAMVSPAFTATSITSTLS